MTKSRTTFARWSWVATAAPTGPAATRQDYATGGCRRPRRRSRLAGRRMTLEVSDDARRFIARQGYDPVFGARPLRRFIAREWRPGSGARC